MTPVQSLNPAPKAPFADPFVNLVMKLVAWMILLSGVVLLILAIMGPGNHAGVRFLRQVRNSLSVAAPHAQTPDKAALQHIKREHASGRFPFLVSSLCRDFLQRYATSPYRAEVESILKRNQEHTGEAESARSEIQPGVPAPTTGGDVTPPSAINP